MFLFITALILFVAGAVVALFIKGIGLWRFLIAAGLAILGLILLFTATFWTNGPGESKIQVNSLDRSYSQELISGSASGFRAPWIDFVEWDNSNQELVYAGGDQAPSYTGGTINGREITVSVGGINGGSTQANIDATFVYSLDPSEILAIYKKYPYPDAQARFTKAIIEKQVLSTARQVPSDYTATSFRGVDRAEAEVAIGKLLNERLGEFGVVFSIPTIQDVRYPDSVEEALKAVEVANQKQQEAEANLRATEVSSKAQIVEAEAQAKAAIAKASGEAEANRLLAASLTPEVLQAKLIEAYDEGTVFVTDGNSNVLIQK